MTDRCEACWVDADYVVRAIGGSREDRYDELVRARHSEEATA